MGHLVLSRRVIDVTGPGSERVTAEKIGVFRSCFSGLERCYGTYDPRTGRAFQRKQSVTDQVILRHLGGDQPYGVYLLVGDRTKAVVADFDNEDPWPLLEFIRSAARYGVPAYAERSKSKGWHAWVFAEPPHVTAGKARGVVRLILNDIDLPGIEVFPKQDRLNSNASFGNFINAPLFGTLVPKGRTVFVDPEGGLRPFPDQWGLLRTVRRVSEALLDSILEINAPSDGAYGLPLSSPMELPSRAGQRFFGLPLCAQRMLAEGVVANQRLACFHLAVQLKNAGLPCDLAVSCLLAWAGKNRPRDGRTIITPAEIAEQASHGYSEKYRGCGCTDASVLPYCTPDCPLKKLRAAAPAADNPKDLAPQKPPRQGDQE